RQSRNYQSAWALRYTIAHRLFQPARGNGRFADHFGSRCPGIRANTAFGGIRQYRRAAPQVDYVWRQQQSAAAAADHHRWEWQRSAGVIDAGAAARDLGL